MLTISYNKLRSPLFTDGIRRIATYTGFKDIGAAYQCGKVCKALDTEFELSQKLYIDVIKKYADTDKEGQFINMGKDEQFHVPEGKHDEFNTASELFHKHSIEIEADKLKIPGDDLVGMNLAPAHLTQLEDVLDLSEL